MNTPMTRMSSRPTLFALAVAAAVLLQGSPAQAADTAAVDDEPLSLDDFLVDVERQSDDDDDAPDDDEGTVREDRRRDRSATRSRTGRKRIIKVVQRRHFLKLGRLEATVPTVGLVTNDPFLRRILFSGRFEFHMTEISSVGLFLSFSPNLGESDLKQLTSQMQSRKEVVPDISRMLFAGVIDLGFSPIFGKIELGTTRIINYDIYFGAGAGVLYTKDDEDLVQGGKEKYRSQVHPVTSLNFGFRIAFNEWFGVRLEGRLMTHIEQVDRAEGLNLEMKNNFIVHIGPSFFLPPRMKQFSK